MDGDSISISHKGHRDLLAVPTSYRAFDKEFCAAVHAMRKSGAAKPTPAKKAALLAMLPLKVFVGEVYVKKVAVFTVLPGENQKPGRKPRRHNMPAGVPSRDVALLSL